MDDRPTVPSTARHAEPGPVATPEEFEPFVFGKYDILEEIGRGGMGVVYRAYQRDLDRDVAIKMVLAHLVSAPEFANRFHSEAKAAAKVSHANIVSIYETGVHNGQHYIAMQLVGGSSLAALFATGDHELRDAVRAIAQIARAVHHLHEHDILHLDLKPSNMLVAEDGHPYLMDFGLAQIRGQIPTDASSDGGIAGTPGYIAPEIVQGGESRATPRADVYSLGAALYEAATGRSPFADSSPVQALVNVLEKDPVRPRSILASFPVGLETVILKCLERDPARRYATAEDLADDLDRWLIGEPISATPPAGLHRLRRWIRGHTSLFARLIGFAVFFLITLWNTSAQVVTPDFLGAISVWLGVWAIASIACEFLQLRHPSGVRIAWATIDMAMMTMLLRLADGVASPLLLVYPLLVVTSGFWYRVSLVVYMTSLTLLSYGILVLDTALRRPELQVALDRHLIFCSVVLLTGVVIGMQTRRARAISLYHAKRAL